jgi:hypothetical protein
MFIDFVHCPVFFQKHDVSETGTVSIFIVLERIMLMDFVHHTVFFSKTRFGNWICFCLQLTLSKGPNRVGATSVLPEDGTNPVPETCFWKKHWMMGKVHKHDSFKCNAPSSEPFRIEVCFHTVC